MDPIIGTLDEIHSRGHSYCEVYTDWLDLMLYALQRDDDAYLEIVGKYDNDRPEGVREIDLYAQAFTRLQAGMAATNVDLLGEVCEKMSMSSDAFGQYFTPHNVCDAMAAMNMAVDETEQYTRHDPLTVSDPCSGSGRMLVSAAKHIPEEVPHVVYYGQDKDVKCAKMTALNLCFFNLDGYAVHGDSLKVERRNVWATRSTMLGGEVRELAADEFTNQWEQRQQTTEETESAGVEQQAAVSLREATLGEFEDNEGGA